MNNKDIKKDILSSKYSVDKLDSYIQKDYKNTVIAIENAIFAIVNKSNNNKLKLDSLLNYLEDIVDKEDDRNKLIHVYKRIEDLISKIDKHLHKNRCTNVKELLERLRKILIKIEKRNKQNYIDETADLLEKIIYEEHDLIKLGKIVRRQKDLFKDKNRRVVFENLLRKYVELDYRSDEALYYFCIISMILASDNRIYILIEKDKYINILSKHKKSKGVSLVMSKFEKDFTTSLGELGKRYDISYDFSKLAKNSILNKPDTNHFDVTMYPSVAIDEEGNECNDDAFCLYPNYDGTYTLRIDISSVPALVKYGSYIDRQAYKRTETIYLSDGEIPMYPGIITYDKGSLLENTDRYVLSFFYRVDSNFDIIEDSFEVKACKARIAYNLSHEQANLLLQGNSKDNLSIMLKNLSYVASKMNNGKKQIIDAKSIVQKFMMLPNYSISMMFKRLGYPFIYRIHKRADNEVRLDVKDKYNNFINGNAMCKKILKIIETNYEEGIYSSEPQIHEALGLDIYGNITKPLRNYPSAIDEYIIYDVIINNNCDNKTLYNWEEILKEMCAYMNDRIRLNKLFQSEYEGLLTKNKIKRK